MDMPSLKSPNDKIKTAHHSQQKMKATYSEKLLVILNSPSSILSILKGIIGLIKEISVLCNLQAVGN